MKEEEPYGLEILLGVGRQERWYISDLRASRERAQRRPVRVSIWCGKLLAHNVVTAVENGFLDRHAYNLSGWKKSARDRWQRLRCYNGCGTVLVPRMDAVDYDSNPESSESDGTMLAQATEGYSRLDQALSLDTTVDAEEVWLLNVGSTCWHRPGVRQELTHILSL